MTRDEWNVLHHRARELAKERCMSYEEALLLEIERTGYKLVKA